MEHVDPPDPIQLLGVNIHPVTWHELISYVDARIVNGQKCDIAYVNAHCMNVALKDQEYKDILNGTQIVYCDGFGILMGAKIFGHKFPQRMTGADWMNDLISYCEKASYSLYFLGGEEGVAETAAHRLKTLFPKTCITGTHHGYFDKGDSRRVLEDINRRNPDILLIGLGSPLQEKWLSRHRDLIDAPVCWVVGAAFDFVSGKVRRGPKWMTANGMEWLFRLFIEPGRLWYRYLIGNPLFIYHVVMGRLLGAHRGRP
jgi:N-acetylglucosaminyldiphosphoundecaprenol N-acetyl-beta-D-mannosaminyltransferase